MEDLQQLQSDLALAKDVYQRLTRELPSGSIFQAHRVSPVNRDAAVHHLRSLIQIRSRVESAVSLLTGDADAPPLVMLNRELARFHQEILRPLGKQFQIALWKLDGTWEQLGEFGVLIEKQETMLEEEKVLPGTCIADTLSTAVEYAIENSVKEELQWWADDLDLSGAREFINSTLFRPDEWIENQEMLIPVSVDRKPSMLRDHIRVRLTEIYQSFIFGQWMAVAALCRSTMEYALKDRAPALGIEIEIRAEAPGPRPRDKRLAELIDDVSEMAPQLRDPLETVRQTANRVLHPKKRDVIALPRVLRHEAFECVEATRRVLEQLYSLTPQREGS